jgi:hypothetical protein
MGKIDYDHDLFPIRIHRRHRRLELSECGLDKTLEAKLGRMKITSVSQLEGKREVLFCLTAGFGSRSFLRLCSLLERLRKGDPLTS